MPRHFARRDSPDDDERMHVDEDVVPPGSDDEMDDVQNGDLNDDDVLGKFE